MSKNSRLEKLYVRSLSVSVYPKHLEIIENYRREHGLVTVSDAVRRLIEEYIRLKEKIRELQEENRSLREIIKEMTKR